MALNKAGLISAIQAVLEDLDSGKSAADKATELADAIDTYIKSASVTTTVVGVCPSGGGPLTGGAGTGTLA